MRYAFIIRFMRKTLVFILVFLSAKAFPSPIEALLERIDKGASRKFVIEQIASENDFFELDQQGEKVVIRGNNNISIAVGINWYLKYYAGIHLCWNNMNAKLPKHLPPVTKKEYHSTKCRYRYYLNYCTFSYSMPFWNWERWEKELDWMALHGINLALATTGNEMVWLNVLKKLGYNQQEVDSFVAGPCFTAWWQMNNLEGWGGATPLSRYHEQCLLQQKILSRMRELGIEPILPGFGGMMPSNSDKKLGINTIDTGTWCGYSRPSFLLPSDTNFFSIANLFYQEQEKLYGTAKFYSVDPFHEGGNSSQVNFQEVGKNIVHAMKQQNQEAVWVIQAWENNPAPTMIDELKAGDLLILDLCSDTRPQWGDPEFSSTRKDGFGQHDWIFSMLLNFGANVGLFGKTDAVTHSFFTAKNHPQFSKTLKGIGLTPEGIENNPVMYELFTELAWRDSIFAPTEWVENYTKARYGKTNKQLTRAWKILFNTIYNCPKSNQQQGCHESIFCARPSLKANQVSAWANTQDYYSPDSVMLAAELLLASANEFYGNNNFEYDLIDILRQAIAEKGRITLRQIEDAVKALDEEKYLQTSNAFLRLILLQDELLATRSEFMLGTWLEMAKTSGKNRNERALYEWNARTQITTWGNRVASENGCLHDYAHKEWNGILRDLYYERWKLFFSKINIESGIVTEPDIDYFSIESDWCLKQNKYATKPKAKAIDKAKSIFDAIFR